MRSCLVITASVFAVGYGLRRWLRIHNKLDAIRLLGLELGMFKEKPTVDADV